MRATFLPPFNWELREKQTNNFGDPHIYMSNTCNKGSCACMLVFMLLSHFCRSFRSSLGRVAKPGPDQSLSTQLILDSTHPRLDSTRLHCQLFRGAASFLKMAVSACRDILALFIRNRGVRCGPQCVFPYEMVVFANVQTGNDNFVAWTCWFRSACETPLPILLCLHTLPDGGVESAQLVSWSDRYPCSILSGNCVGGLFQTTVCSFLTTLLPASMIVGKTDTASDHVKSPVIQA